MQIHCPICSTSIDVSEDHAGHKGRCLNCSTKFIIPEDPNGNIEILERGEEPHVQSESDNAAESKEGVESAGHAPVLNAPALNAPALNAPATRSYTAVRPRYQKKSGSPMGFLIIVVLVLAAGTGFYFHLSGKKITISDNKGEVADQKTDKKIVKVPIKVNKEKTKTW